MLGHPATSERIEHVISRGSVFKATSRRDDVMLYVKRADALHL